MSRPDGKKIAFLALMTALAMILSYVESLLPFTGFLPGFKVGLANLVTLFLLYRVRPSEAFLVTLLRVIALSVLFGNVTGFVFSLAGFLASFGAMALLKKTGKFHVISVSVTGGVVHNLAQIAAAFFLIGTPGLGFYGAHLSLLGALSGCVIGILGAVLVKRIRLPLLEEKSADDRSDGK